MQETARYRVLEQENHPFADLRAVHQYWDERRGERFAPAWSDIDLLSLPAPVIPRICVVDSRNNGTDFTYRFWGTAITDMHHYDLTGKSVLDLEPSHYARSVRDQYALVVESREPVLFLNEVPVPSGLTTFYAALRMPLTTDGAEVDILMSAEEYGENRKQLEDYFEEAWREHENQLSEP